MQFFSVKEISNILKTTINKIYTLIRKGEIKYRRISGGRIEIPESEVEKLTEKYQKPFSNN